VSPSSSSQASHAAENLLVFSDVHLGSDLNDCGASTVRRTSSIDRDLIALLAHYQGESRHVPGRWRVVIAGDFIDFIGMSIKGELGADLTDEELAHGLSNAEAHSREKLRRVAIRHSDVLAALAAFVADGHALTIIHGNHDIEFHWDGVKRDFRDVLLEHVRAQVEADAFHARIEFQPWFFYRNGVAYIEHGHQYDTFSSTAHIMAPLSPADPKRVARGFGDTLLRFVVRPTRGMTEHGHERLGIPHYVAFGIRLGVGGMMRLLMRFVRAIAELFRLRRAHLSHATALLRAEHEKRVARLAQDVRVKVEHLHTLLALQARPIAHTVSGILASLLLDRAALAFFAVVAAAVSTLLARNHYLWHLATVGVFVLWTIAHRALSRRRMIDPEELLAQRAAQLSPLFPAAFIVMGHTHTPQERPAGAATYINLGSWAEEEALPDANPLEEPPRAARTHLVIRVGEQGTKAELCAWDSEAGVARACKLG
jgi:UDP-2,3-diacylglucosamine pyrophosphatase LpxH